MTALAGYWSSADQAAAVERCRAMLAHQAGLGAGTPSQRSLGRLSLGCDLMARLPEDRFDRQPIGAGEGRFAFVADVRLDNRAELVGMLGLSPRDRADADILLEALLHWGDDAVDRLVGDFAFAFFDATRQRLLLARDPLGQRPLFWSRSPAGFGFASMPRGLHALPDLPRSPDLDTHARFVASIPGCDDATFFVGVRKVRPGHVLVVTPEGCHHRLFWDPPRHEHRFASFDAAVEQLRSEIDQAVGCRLRGADTLVASHLSGGWDSSTVTATAARLIGGDGEVVAFTAAPPAAAALDWSMRFGDEGPLAAATAKLYPNVDHRMVPSSGYSMVDYLDRTAGLFERPPYNPDNHGWLAAIRDSARDAGASVLLTGEVGNWTMSGAPNYLLADYLRTGNVSEWWREAHGMLRDGRARLRGVAAASFGPWLPMPLWKRVRGMSFAAPPETALRPEMAAPLADEIEDRLFGSIARPKDHWLRARIAYGEMDFGQYRKGILAGWGLDKRDATADRRLIEFCLGLPTAMLLSGGTRRPLARAALSDRLPAAVLDERRKGLQAADWYLDLDRERPKIEALVRQIAGHPAANMVVDTAKLSRWIEDWPAGDWNRPDNVARYRVALPVALAAGHFAVHASG